MSGEDPTLERTFRGHKGPVTSLSFDPRHPRLASGSLDGTVMLWHFNPRLRATRLSGHGSAVHSVEFGGGGSSTGSLLVTASGDATVRVWDRRAMRGSGASGGLLGPAGKGKVSGGSKSAFSSSSSSSSSSASARGSIGPCGETVLRGHGGPVRCARFSAVDGGARIVSCGDDKQVKVWDTARACFARGLSGHANWVRACDFSPDGRLVVSGGDDGTVRLWDVASREAIAVHQNYSSSSSGSVSTGTSPVTDVAFHADGSCVASSSNDGSVRLWDVRTGRLLQHYGAHKDAAHSVAFHPSGGYLLSASSDATARVWDLHEGHLFYTLIGHEGPVLGCAVSGDGEFLASGGADGQVMVWRANFWDAAPGAEHGAEGNEAGKGKGKKNVSKAKRSGRSSSSLPAHQDTAAGPASTKPRFSTNTNTNSTNANAKNNNTSGRVRANVGIESITDAVFPPEPTRNAAPSVATSRRVTTRPAFKTGPSTRYEQTVHETVRVGDGVTAEGPDGLSADIPVDEVRSFGDGAGPGAAQRFAQTLEHIVSQLDVLTRTVTLLDRRLGMNEDRIEAIERRNRGDDGGVASSAAASMTHRYASGHGVDDDDYSDGGFGGDDGDGGEDVAEGHRGDEDDYYYYEYE